MPIRLLFAKRPQTQKKRELVKDESLDETSKSSVETKESTVKSLESPTLAPPLPENLPKVEDNPIPDLDNEYLWLTNNVEAWFKTQDGQ